MSTLATPSAKSHERVTGRWIRDIQVESRRDWIVYYIKQVFGTPIPWLMTAYAFLIFCSRAGLEIVAWACSILTLGYIIADRYGRTREFSFFRVGADIYLLGYLLVTLVTAATSDSALTALRTVGDARWILLLYALTYCWELFPGLNRLFFLLVGAACTVSIYGVWQHFTGLDLVRDNALAYAPVSERVYFQISGFFRSPEQFATVLAMVLPFPVAAFLLNERFGDRRGQVIERWLPVALALLLSLAILWTYHFGLWMAAALGLVVTALIRVRTGLLFTAILAAFISIVLFAAYGSPQKVLDSVQSAELIRAERQRSQINTQVALWEKSSWFGVGSKASEIASGTQGSPTEKGSTIAPNTGNVYFQILAQTGLLGVVFYLLFLLSFLLSTYRVFHEIPQSHYWHRVLIVGGLGSQVAFHAAGLYWSTITEALSMNFFILVLSAIGYLTEHYNRGLVPDDSSL